MPGLSSKLAATQKISFRQLENIIFFKINWECKSQKPSKSGKESQKKSSYSSQGSMILSMPVTEGGTICRSTSTPFFSKKTHKIKSKNQIEQAETSIKLCHSFWTTLKIMFNVVLITKKWWKNIRKLKLLSGNTKKRSPKELSSNARRWIIISLWHKNLSSHLLMCA